MDRDEFDALLLAHLDEATRFAVRLAGRVDLAEDIAQDAVTNATAAWRTYRGAASFRTWLFQIVLNAFRDSERRAARRPTMRLTSDPPGVVEVSDDASGRELAEQVAVLVSSLPPRQREVLVLVTYEQMSPVEAAAVLGITEQNLRTTLHLARAKLKEQLAGYLGERFRK